jgi:predicted MPP superfamily phosphohydrolase
MGIQFLENRHAVLERNGALLALVGLQDGMARHGHFRDIRFGPGPSPEVAIQGIPPTAWRLCLSHRPSDWHLARRTGSRLTLSGHTHGGQVNLIPGLSSALIMGPYTHGLYTKDDDHLYVNRGLGVVGLPVRIGSPPEITVLTLHRG